MRKFLLIFCFFLWGTFFLFHTVVFGFICNFDQSEPISITIEKIDPITELDSPVEVRVVLKNDSEQSLTVELSANSIESVRIAEDAKRTFEIPAKETVRVPYSLIASQGTYSAHYPVHVFAKFDWEGKTQTLHPVQVVQTDLGSRGVSPQVVGKNSRGEPVLLGDLVENAEELPILDLSEGTGFFLPNTKAYRVIWNFDRDPDSHHVLPIGFFGSDPTSSTHFAIHEVVRDGLARNSFSVHPPWKGGPGTMFTDYRVRLPKSGPISFAFFGALRDTRPEEPQSDGITYRIWADQEVVHEVHLDSKRWVRVEADLTKFAGKEILLRLESDPGPARNTTCDGGFWGDPMISCGEKTDLLTERGKEELFAENHDALKTGRSSQSRTVVRKMRANGSEKPLFLALTFGDYGLIDGVIGFGNENEQVQYDGLKVWIEGQQLGSDSGLVFLEKFKKLPADSHRDAQPRFEQVIRWGNRSAKMGYGIRFLPEGVALSVNCSEDAAITRMEFGPATHHASRVYFGHGYCIEEPEAFQISNGGHSLSTSHIGFDFENGLSLLMGTSFPPEKIVVNPESKIYTLQVYPGTTFTLIPGHRGALDCAIRYRPFYDKTAAPGVVKKAGRFAFDWWGGKFTEQTRRIQEHIDYGITDSLVVVHNWQRWGYDNRLPDIFPPNPRFGTVEQARETLELCRKHDILYGLHDNYIDIYPDADDFNYDLVSFEKHGEPRKAWKNHGIDAQSYQFRPDRILPFIDRNFDLISPHLQQSTYFVDVFASTGIMDFRDREGNLHSRRETLDYWCRAFDLIRERLGNDQPTISEAGSDFLIGHLDGSDCQFLTLSNDPGDFRIVLKCKTWSRIPWFDAVNHTRFSLHGVGYDSRYAANRGYDLHGYSSDDYISTEILTGHAMQVGIGTPLREAVRKYWLAQPLIRELADKEIESVEFSGGNVQRFTIRWSGGTTVHVNQGREDWDVRKDISIPQYGYFAENSSGLSSGIVRIGKNVVEYSECISKETDGLKTFYVNPRKKVPKKFFPILPQAEKFLEPEPDKFGFEVRWNVMRPVSQLEGAKDWEWFLHLEEPKYAWFHHPQPVPIAGEQPATPVSRWKEDQIISTGPLSFPEELPGGTYNVLIGLWDPTGDKSRAPILGFTPDNSRIQLGRLHVEKSANGSIKYEFSPTQEDAPELFERLLPNPSIDSGFPLPIHGAYRQIQYENGEVSITPLPDEPDFEVILSISAAGSLTAVDREGKTIRKVPFTAENERIRFTTKEGEFSYFFIPSPVR